MQEYTKEEITVSEIVPLAKKMREEGRQLVTIHGYVNKEGTTILSYDYEVGKGVKAYEVIVDGAIPTISDVYSLAAQWLELELYELVGIEFEGLDTSKRLFLADTMMEGQGQILVTPLAELKAMNEREANL